MTLHWPILLSFAVLLMPPVVFGQTSRHRLRTSARAKERETVKIALHPMAETRPP